MPQPLMVNDIPLSEPPSGPLSVGWAGNPRDPEKNFETFFPGAVPDRARFEPATGQYSLEQMAGYYAGLDVLCVTSRSEGLPQPLVEALAAGCFVIATDVGLVPELIEPGINGRVIPPDPAALRAVLEECLGDTGQLRARRREIAVRFRQHWSDTMLRERWERFYTRALARAEASGAARVQPGIGHHEEARVLSRFRWPTRATGAIASGTSIGDALPARVLPGHELTGTVSAGSNEFQQLIRRLAGANVCVTAVSQTLPQRAIARGLRQISMASRRMKLEAVARQVDRLPTRYDLAVRGLHSDC
jgi:hypothetical protein